MKHMTEINTKIDEPLSNYGFNQKFLETETGRALVEALTMLGKSGFAPDNTLVEDQEGVIDEQNVKD